MCAHKIFTVRNFIFIYQKMLKKNVVIYQTKNESIKLRGNMSHETVWATQK